VPGVLDHILEAFRANQEKREPVFDDLLPLRKSF
jgi:hypothetical protein